MEREMEFITAKKVANRIRVYGKMMSKSDDLILKSKINKIN